MLIDNLLPPSAVESLARQAHESYRVRSSAPAIPPPWESLDEVGKEANRDSVRFAPVLLRALGLHVGSTPTTTSPQVVLTDEEVEAGARLEHLRWARFTRAARPGHPDLEPWDRLDEPTREKDRARVREAVALLASAGVDVRRVSWSR